MAALNQRLLRSLTYTEVNGRAQYFWDDQLAGFGARVYASGRISFVVAYRLAGRQSFRVIGRYGELTVQQARTKAMQYLAAARAGEDPGLPARVPPAETAEAPAEGGEAESRTVSDLYEAYMERHAKRRKKPSSVTNDEILWRRHVLPALGQVPVLKVTEEQIEALHASKTTQRVTGNRMLALLSKAFNLAERWGWRPRGTNPCRYVERYPERRRDRFLSDTELQRLAAVLNRSEAFNRGDLAPEEPVVKLESSVIAAVRLLLFTGCRVGEILRLEWSEVDLDRGLLRLRDSKTGPKAVPLSQAAIDLLAGLPAVGRFVLPSERTGRPLVGLRYQWPAIQKAAGLEDVRIHDLRHSFASLAIAEGIPLATIGGLLGHARSQTTERYAHLANHTLRQAADRIAVRLDAFRPTA